ncbi:MAG: hypothetical protein GY703_05625 [Gammaproteobacteria bacterium]|nr:hypothetical protein [Gammaproteobacteria bacterium]
MGRKNMYAGNVIIIAVILAGFVSPAMGMVDQVVARLPAQGKQYPIHNSWILAFEPTLMPPDLVI